LKLKNASFLPLLPYSSGKQIETLVAAILVDRGLIDYDEKVATYWPEFAQGDKGEITVAMVLRHEGGCPWFLNPNKCKPGDHGVEPDDFVFLSASDLLNPSIIDKTIEVNPRVQYGTNQDGSPTARTYHAMTRGLILDGILRRVDPAGRGMAQFVSEEICKPLGVTEYHVALSEAEQSRYNIAHIGPPQSTFGIHMEFGPTVMGIQTPDLMHVLNFVSPNKPLMKSGMGSDILLNPVSGKFDPSRAALPHVIATPATSSFNNASARAQALIYATYAEGGSSILSPQAVAKVFEKEVKSLDGAFGYANVFTQGGISKIAENHMDEPRHDILRHYFKGLYGWGGIGGSKCFVDPEKKVTFIYTMSGMSSHQMNCPRINALLAAYQECIEKIKK
jgi:CubicO group peptidase (beta-lactamase class C family)